MQSLSLNYVNKTSNWTLLEATSILSPRKSSNLTASINILRLAFLLSLLTASTGIHHPFTRKRLVAHIACGHTSYSYILSGRCFLVQHLPKTNNLWKLASPSTLLETNGKLVQLPSNRLFLCPSSAYAN